jgi:predicted nucleotide-binding protein (sugar kinase/HSP70/actin superfamily)
MFGINPRSSFFTNLPIFKNPLDHIFRNICFPIPLFGGHVFIFSSSDVVSKPDVAIVDVRARPASYQQVPPVQFGNVGVLLQRVLTGWGS